ncbi:MAG: hypothetical protein WDW38_001221 [Sanguina aurantia]
MLGFTEDASRVIELAPHMMDGFYHKGFALFHLEHYTDAARAFQQGLALNPTDRTLRQGFWDSMNLLSQSRTNSGELVHQAGLVSSATSPSALVNDEQRRARSRLQAPDDTWGAEKLHSPIIGVSRAGLPPRKNSVGGVALAAASMGAAASLSSLGTGAGGGAEVRSGGGGAAAAAAAAAAAVNVVFKFGGSSVRDAERMMEVADIVCSFPEFLPCVVLSAMGKSTNMLLECGDLALVTPTDKISELQPFRALRALHEEACEKLGVEAEVRAEVSKLLNELNQLLTGIAIMQDLTPRAKDSLVSFGERLSTRIFASYLRSQGIPARQYDSWKLGVITSDEFTNAEVMYDESFPAIRASLIRLPGSAHEIPIVTGFLGKGITTGAITTLGRGGSDLTATVLGAALGLKEVQVSAEEARSQLVLCAGAHPLAMQPAVKSGNLAVRVKNSYNRRAEGTIITATRDMSNVLVTSVVLKPNVTLVDIISTRMLGQYGFLATVFNSFKRLKISVDVVATSEVSVSLTLDPKQLGSSADEELDALQEELAKIAQVSHRKGLAIVSLICNTEQTSEILQRAFSVFQREGIRVQMMSQGASKTNISLVIDGTEGKRAIQALHVEFFEPKSVLDGECDALQQQHRQLAHANGNGAAR